LAFRSSRCLLSWSFIAAAAACSPAADRSAGYGETEQRVADEATAFQSVLTKTRALLESRGAPGASVAVIVRGKLAFSAGVGKKDIGTSEDVTEKTLFRAGSMSKMVLAATAMTLVREGKLDLQAPISRYVPWFRLQPGFSPSTITLHQLLSHSSGFPGDTIPRCGADSSGPRQEYLAQHPQPLWAPPGAVYNYSNTGYTLASLVVTASAGVGDAGYERLVHDRVFSPAKMTSATFDAAEAERADHATGYEHDDHGKLTRAITLAEFECPLRRPSGGVVATPSDYAHFAKLLLANGGEGALDEAGVAAMETSHASTHAVDTQAYGYGLFRQHGPYTDDDLLFHAGSVPGFSSKMLLIPAKNFGVIAFANAPSSEGIVDAIGRYAMDAFFPGQGIEQLTKTPPTAWVGYQGTYDDALGTLGTGITVKIQSEEDGTAALIVDAPNATDLNGHPQPLNGRSTQSVRDNWLLPDRDTSATFFPGADGAFKYLVTRRGIATKR